MTTRKTIKWTHSEWVTSKLGITIWQYFVVCGNCGRISQRPNRDYSFFHIVANVLSLSFSLSMVWAPANFLVLETNDTPLPSGPLTMEEASMVASIFGIRGMLGNMLFLWIFEKFGRRFPLLLLAIPQVVRIYSQRICSGDVRLFTAL